MKSSLFYLFAFVLLIAGCDQSKKNSVVIDPSKDPNNPAVQSAPVPTTAVNVPTAPEAAPMTYGNVSSKGVDATVLSTYGSAAMTADMVAAPLIGGWTNQSDPDETIMFTNHSYASYYEGQLIVEEEMTYHARCSGDCNNGVPSQIPCFTISSEFGTDCYGIVRITANELELSLIGKTTETITYVRNMP